MSGVDEDKLRAAVLAALRIPAARYQPDLKLGDLEEWDSLGHLELISQLESTFGVTFNLEDIPQLDSLAAIRMRLREPR
ncbi:MAG: acyl carrier protein [Gammaproteobacteria bacterium]|nr:acyl carrier protein [Gammaproteobacteria bacterium]